MLNLLDLKRGIHIGMGFDRSRLSSSSSDPSLKRGIHIGMGFDATKPQSLIWHCGFINVKVYNKFKLLTTCYYYFLLRKHPFHTPSYPKA
ncbi:protein of unknown function [Maridesulfovibrio hydrothermalis AM13 = DSM 14728]|uniref:Uncharacterized protein n=1 Tax=Maridesulfovibrio hydrothermalis AM13 = DSM 14728 TaxID=1121451 RepID=L0R8V0_9BACT|nr:protein of unknown function [Maridesulfovibrio hydrothermalis AM13 = DSM 14728]